MSERKSPPDPRSHLGRVSYQGDLASLTYERHFPDPPETVWKAITDPEQLAVWYLTRARIDPREGGEVDLVSGPSRFHVVGRILTWDPPRVFEHEWKADPRPELPGGENARIRWELAPEGSGTVLTVVFAGLHRPTALGFAAGMHAFLDRLEAQRSGGPLPNWRSRSEELRPLYPSWRVGA